MIDNKQTGDVAPVNETDIDVSLNTTGKRLLAIILFFAILIVFTPLIPYFMKLVFWVASLPFKGIKALRKVAKKNREKRRERRAERKKARMRKKEEP